MGDAGEVIATLAKICGEQHLHAHGDVLAVTPGSVEELAAVLRLATELNLRVSPRGAGTKAGWAGKQDVDLVLLMQRMNVVSEHVWQDMTCTVGAGCRWQDLQHVLARHGQFVALDPLWPDVATVGGVVSANDSGALRLAYGGLRDLVLGMTIVLADGTIARTGGKVVKNVAGYDLHKLMCGAFGTLGVIAEVTFRLHSVLPHTRTYSVRSASLKPLHEMMMQLLNSQHSVQSMQLRVGEGEYALDLRLAALPQVLDAQGEQLRVLAETKSAALEDALEDVWLERQKLMEQSGVVAFKATMLPGDVAEVSEAIVAMQGAAVVQATGISYGAVSPASVEGLALLRRRLRERGGSLTYHGELPEGEVDRWGIAPDVLRWMLELKHQFDPGNVLNPQCYKAGI